MPHNPALLAQLMHRFYGEVGRRSSGRGLQELHDLGLSMPQMIALHVLFHCRDAQGADQGMPMNQLGEVLKLSPSTMTALVDRLVDRQLVERWENPADRRQKQIRLRPEGIGLLDRMNRSRALEMSEALEVVPEDLQNALLDVLERVVTAMHTAPSPYPPIPKPPPEKDA